MEKKQVSEMNEFAANTGSNFFNSSQDQFNKLMDGQLPLPVNSIFDPVNTSSDKKNQFQHESIFQDIIEQNGPAAGNNRKRYGNHRNKTTRGFERANLQKAISQCKNKSNREHKGKPVPLFPSQSHFQNFSPGIYLFFSFLKRTSILFFILSLFSLFPIVYNYLNGTYYQYYASTFQVQVAKMMLGNQVYQSNDSAEALKDKLFNMIPGAVIILCFLCFYIFWESFSKKVESHFEKGWKRMSQYTIEVTKFDGKVSQSQMQQFFSKYGAIQQIAAVKNYQQMIDISKQVYELSLQLKQESIIEQNKLAINKEAQPSKSHIKTMQKKQDKLSNLLNKLQQIQEKREKKNIKYYITYEEMQSVENVMQAYRPFDKLCCAGKIPQELKIHGGFPKIKKCCIQPAEIIWENIHITRKSRWGRFIIQFLIVVVVICIGFVIITVINISTPPTSYDDVKTDKLTFSEVKANNTFPVAYTWCLNKYSASSLTADQSNYCQKYITNSKVRILLTISITLVIIIVKGLLKTLMIKIAHFQRYKNHTELSTNVMTNLFVIYISTTVMITFLMQANIFGVSAKKIVGGLLTHNGLLQNLGYIKEYKDFVQDWYKDIGYQIWLNWLILSIFPHPFSPLYFFIKNKINLYRCKSKILQKNILQLLQPEQFEIEDNYANILMLIFVGLIFSGGIPFLIVFTFVGLVTRYFILRAIFVKFCRIPKYYTSSINQRVQLLLQVTIVLHIALAIWMFGISQIFGYGDRLQFFQIGSDSGKNGWFFILKKLTAHWYFTLLMAIALAFLLFNKIVIETIIKFCHRQRKDAQIHPEAAHNSKDIKKTQVSLTQSYKIENNPNYFEILAIMKPQQIQSRIKKTQNQNIQIGSPGASYAGMLSKGQAK